MTKKKTHEEFCELVFNLVGNEYILIDHYNGANNQVLMKHRVCGHEWKIMPSNFTRGRRCPRCSLIHQTQKGFIEVVRNLTGSEYCVLGKYTKAKEKIKMRHVPCGNEYYVSPNNFQSGNRCPQCNKGNKGNKITKTDSKFKSEVFDLVGDEYSINGIYENAKTFIEIKHNLCGYVYNAMPDKFLSGRRCPKCKESRGRKAITDFAEKYNIPYSIEKKFSKCRNIHELPFDVCLDNKILIEYDGEGHFQPFRFSKDKDKMLQKLKRVQHNDRIKNHYCVNNYIPLIRIPYWELNNVEQILTNVLGYYNLIYRSEIDEKLIHKFLVNHPDWSHEKYIEQNQYIS